MRFSLKVYEIVKKIPQGKVTTYKIISDALGCRAYQAVGNALSKNYNKTVPCHRVVKSDGRVGGFRGKTNGKEALEKIRLLEKEGVKVKNNKIDLERYLFKI